MTKYIRHMPTVSSKQSEYATQAPLRKKTRNADDGASQTMHTSRDTYKMHVDDVFPERLLQVHAAAVVQSAVKTCNVVSRKKYLFKRKLPH